jgi:hypothetical protein
MPPTDDGPAIATPNSDPRVVVYRVIDAAELAHLRMTGSYGSNASRSGKYFAMTLAGARAFAATSMNAGSTITETTLPQSVVGQGWRLVDPGRRGAGPSVYFSEQQLPMVYTAMTPPNVTAGAGQVP